MPNRPAKKTDRQLEEEAKVAINQVITVHKGLAALRIRPEIRRAFPFGPKATDREKRIWEKTMMAAMKELESWPKPIVMAALALVLSCQSVFAADPMLVSDGKHWYRVTDPNALVMVVAMPKIPFSIKHPKWHKFGRGCRKACQVSAPALNVASKTAQVVEVLK